MTVCMPNKTAMASSKLQHAIETDFGTAPDVAAVQQAMWCAYKLRLQFASNANAEQMTHDTSLDRNYTCIAAKPDRVVQHSHTLSELIVGTGCTMCTRTRVLDKPR